MISAMQEYFDGEIRFNRPQGGLFTWVEMPEQVNAVELLKRCLQHNVAFVPGDSFFPNRQVANTFRLNYSNMPEERIQEGIRRLARVIREF